VNRYSTIVRLAAIWVVWMMTVQVAGHLHLWWVGWALVVAGAVCATMHTYSWLAPTFRQIRSDRQAAGR